MTPSVPGKAYFIAENQRHNAASSASVNSYLPGPEALPISADLLLRNISGKGMTFVLSDSSSTAPPLVEPATPREMAPNLSPSADAKSVARRQSMLLEARIRSQSRLG
jgi:hypothetical protein